MSPQAEIQNVFVQMIKCIRLNSIVMQCGWLLLPRPFLHWPCPLNLAVQVKLIEDADNDEHYGEDGDNDEHDGEDGDSDGDNDLLWFASH